MKYRIKTVTYKTGRKECFAQVKTFINWRYLNYLGEVVHYAPLSDTREEALDRIDKHYEGNAKPQSIEFEYIIK